jgi:hypothetical protein
MFSVVGNSISLMDLAIFLGIMTIIGFLIWAAFFIVTITCAYIIHFISMLFKGRNDAEVSWVIAGHASIGWTFTGFTWVAGWSIDRLIHSLVPTHSQWHLRIQTMTLIDSVIVPTFIGGIILGSLIFLYITYLGIIHTRYINPIPPQEPNNG